MGEDAEEAVAFQKYLDAVDAFTARTIEVLFPALADWPAWLIRYLQPKMQRAVLALHAAGQTDERIAALVAMARAATSPEVPASAPNAAEFIQAAYDLANIQWALTLEKAEAIRELAGEEAAKNYERSAKGQKALLGISDPARRERDSQIVARAVALRSANPRLGDRGAARILEAEFHLSNAQLRKILQKGR